MAPLQTTSDGQMRPLERRVPCVSRSYGAEDTFLDGLVLFDRGQALSWWVFFSILQLKMKIGKAEVTNSVHYSIQGQKTLVFGALFWGPGAISPKILWDHFCSPIPLPSLVQIHTVSEEIYKKMSSSVITISAWSLYRLLTVNYNSWSTVCGKKVSPKVICHFLSNHLEFLHEILHIYYSFIYTYKKAQLSLTNPRDACKKFAWFT